MQYQSPGLAIADSYNESLMQRAALEHQALRDSIDLQRARLDQRTSDLDMQEKEYQRGRQKVLQRIEGLQVGDYMPPDLIAEARKFNVPLPARKTVDAPSTAPLAEGESPIGNLGIRMNAPAAPTETYAGTPTQQAADALPDGPVKAAMLKGAPEGVVRILATEQERKDALAQRAAEFAENQANRMQIATVNAADREAAQQATEAYRQQSLTALNAYRQGQLNERQMQLQLTQLSIDLRRQMFETTKANAMTPEQRAAFNKIVAEKMKAATPGFFGSLMSGSSGVPDDQVDQILSDAYAEATKVGTGAGAGTAGGRGGTPKTPPIVGKIKGLGAGDR